MAIRNVTRRSFAVESLSMAGALVGITSLISPALAQDYRFNPEHRRPVETTMHDVEEISAQSPDRGDQRRRYENARRHLHEFAERLHEGGRFDKDKLDQAIGDVQSIIDHNRMDERAHDVLMRDVTDLRELREHYDEHYRYEHGH